MASNQSPVLLPRTAQARTFETCPFSLYYASRFPPCVVSTSGRIHGDLLRLLHLLADNKTKRHFRDLDEAIDVDSEAYCWRRSGFFWRMRASLGLACAQATTLSSQVFGKSNPRSRAGRPRV